MRIFLFTLFISFHCLAQTLEYDTFIHNVMLHHPVAKSAKFKIEIGKAEALAGKGGFDPKIFAKYNEKQFKDKNYFQLLKVGFSVPTWMGLSITGDYEENEGVFLNPENNVPTSGLYALGAEWNVIQGLLFDQRRADLRKGKLLQKASANESRILLNKLLKDATKAYADWLKEYNIYQNTVENVSLASNYFEATKETYNKGFKAAVDTLESSISVNDAELIMNQQKINLLKSKLKLESYLWMNNQPIELSEKATPVINFSIAHKASFTFNDEQIAKLPEVLEYQYKRDLYDIELRLKKEKLKPKLKLKYNALYFDKQSPVFNENDYKWGLSFEFPILIRDARGNVKKTKFKIKDAEQKIENVKNKTKLELEYNQQSIKNLRKQIDLINTGITSTDQLLKAEEIKFRIGESSVFLLNKRQEKLLKSKNKKQELNFKYTSSYLEYLETTNQMLNLIR